MSDPKKAAEDAGRRAEDARDRAKQARQRADELKLLRAAGGSSTPASAEDARRRSEQAHEAATRAHKDAADLHEQHARHMRQGGHDEAALRAEERADAERERESHAAP